MNGRAQENRPVKTEDRDEEVSRRSTPGKSILVYSHQKLKEAALSWPSKGDLSALVVNGTEVYGTGVNSLIGGACTDRDKMVEGDLKHLQGYTRLKKLSGLNVKKIVVHLQVGAALTGGDEVIVWGIPVPYVIDDFVTFRAYSNGTKACPTCGGKYSRSDVGAAQLDYCASCRKYAQIRYLKNTVGAKTFVRFHENHKYDCSSCAWPCSPLVLNSISLSFCVRCALMLEKDNFIQSTHIPNRVHKITRANDEKVKDVAIVGPWLFMLLNTNRVVARNLLTNVEPMEPEPTDTNANSLVKVALHGGGAGLLVESDCGKLYQYQKCGNFGSILNKLEQVKLPAAVAKVCCGLKTSAALLVDGSVWFVGDNCAIYRLHHSSGVNSFNDVAVVAMTDAFIIRTSACLIEEPSTVNIQLAPGNNRVYVRFTTLELHAALEGMLCPEGDLVPPSPHIAKLYGNPNLADLTIKLADEELPGHSTVLYCTSPYLREVFGDSIRPEVLDASKWNPKAYKYLLQYFYQMKPDDLDAEDFVDLRQIATIYGEIVVADAATAKTRAKLSSENVLRVLGRATRFGFEDLIGECKKILRDPTFTDRVFEAALRNPNATIGEVLESPKVKRPLEENQDKPNKAKKRAA